MPESGAGFDIFNAVFPAHQRQYDNAEHHMQGVKAGGEIIEGKKRIGFDTDAMRCLVGIFAPLDQ